MPGGGLVWRVRPLAALALAALLVPILGLPSRAAADATEAPSEQPAGGELGLEVVLGYGGAVTNAAWMPVEVSLEPLRPLAGRLEVVVEGDGAGPVTSTRLIEVAATSLSRYRFLTPPGRVTVRLVEPDREPVAVQLRRPVTSSEYLVGALGALPASAPPLRQEASGRTGTWVPVDPAWLAEPQALAPLGALVAPVSGLEALPSDAAANLAAAVVAGTDLVVVADRDGPIDLAALGLPAALAVTATSATPATPPQGPLRALAVEGEAWTMTAAEVVDGADPALTVAAAAAAGRGRVTVVGAEPGAGALGGSGALWSAVSGPPIGTAASDWDLSRSPWQISRLLADEDAGVPAVPWLASFLLAYIVVVGPVNGVVLTRFRRRELAWVTVPVVTAVFTAAAFLGAVGARPAIGVSARLAYWVDGVGTEAALVGVRNPTPGVREVSLPGQGWRLQTLGGVERGATLGAGGDGRAELNLAALQLGGIVGTRRLAGTAPLEVEAVPGPQGIDVTVRNTSGEALEAVAVKLGTVSRSLGALEPGAEATLALTDTRLRVVNPYRDVLEGIRTGPSGNAAPPASLEALLRADLLDGNPGLVWAVGSSAAASTGASAGGSPAVDEGTLYAVAARPTLPASGEVSPFAVSRAFLRSPEADQYAPSPLAVEGSGPGVLRFRFPEGGRLEQLRSDLGRTQGEPATLSIWEPGPRTWVPVEQAFAEGGADPARFLSPLGEVYVRGVGAGGTFDFSGRSLSGLDVGEAAR